MTEQEQLQARLQRLRKTGRLRRRKKKMIPTPAPHDAPAPAPLPEMQEISGPGGHYLLRTIAYPLTHQHGPGSLGDLLTLSSRAIKFLSTHPQFDLRQVVFLDTETTGLAGGAGTIVFLTGVGTFEDDRYVVRQFFARTPAEEQAYLPHLADFVAARQGLVTFNGRSFDWPLLRARFTLAGMTPPPEQPHVDLLHLARRLWRPRLGSCTFGNLEQRILNFQRQAQDIPSWMIPSLWFNFVRDQQNTAAMAGVLYHNLEDIVSMVPLAYRIAGILGGDIDPHPQDWPAVARAWLRTGHTHQAEMALRQALENPMPPMLRAQTLRELALLLNRDGRRDEAASWWQALANMNRHEEIESMEMLAKYHEWQTGNLAEARQITETAQQRVRAWRPSVRQRQTLEALAHRAARLARKMA